MEETKTNEIKKTVITWTIIILILVIIIVVSSIIISNNKKAQKNLMNKYAQSYYEKYMVKINAETYKVTLSALQDANKKANANYNLSKLSSCKSTSYVLIYVHNDKITKTDIHISC